MLTVWLCSRSTAAPQLRPVCVTKGPGEHFIRDAPQGGLRTAWAGGYLADPEVAQRRGRPRVLTLELAQMFAAELANDPTHTMESAAAAVGLRSSSVVRECLSRYVNDKCGSPEDEEIGAILYEAKQKHIHELRKQGFEGAERANNPRVSWVKWQLEIQDPANHPRKTAVELTGADGGPVKTQELSTMPTEQLLTILNQTEPDSE